MTYPAIILWLRQDASSSEWVPASGVGRTQEDVRKLKRKRLLKKIIHYPHSEAKTCWAAEGLFQSAGGRWSDPNVSAAPGRWLAGIRVNSTDIPTDLCHSFFAKNMAQDTYIRPGQYHRISVSSAKSSFLTLQFPSHKSCRCLQMWQFMPVCWNTAHTLLFYHEDFLLKWETTLKTKHRGEMPGKKAYADPHMKGFTVHVEVLQQTQHILIASWHSQPSKEKQAAFIPHLVVINSGVQTSDYVISATPSLHFVHAASVAMNHALRSLCSTPAPSFPNC